MAEMYLTEKRDRTPGQERNAKDHAEVEILLESVQKQVEEIVSEVETTIVRPFRITLPIHVLTVVVRFIRQTSLRRRRLSS